MNISSYAQYNGEEQITLEVLVSNPLGEVVLLTRNLNQDALKALRDLGNTLWWCINRSLIAQMTL